MNTAKMKMLSPDKLVRIRERAEIGINNARTRSGQDLILKVIESVTILGAISRYDSENNKFVVKFYSVLPASIKGSRR